MLSVSPMSQAKDDVAPRASTITAVAINLRILNSFKTFRFYDTAAHQDHNLSATINSCRFTLVPQLLPR